MDEGLLRAAKGGDRAALGAVCDWLSAELVAFFRPRVSRETASVLAQQTVVDVLEDFAAAPERPAEFRRWARGYGRIVELRWRRKDARYREVLAEYEDHEPSPARGLESQLRSHEEHELLAAAIDQLPSPYRSTLRLFNEQPNVRELAAALGVAEGTVRWRLMIARQKLDELIPRSPKPVNVAS